MDSAVPNTPTNQASKRRIWLRTALRFVGPVLLALLIWRLPNPWRIGQELSKVAVIPLLLAIALNALSVHLKVLRWDALLRARDIRLPMRRLWSAFLGSLYVGMLTPGRLGDLLRVHYLHQDARIPYAEGFASVVMDRFCDLYILVVFASIGLVRFGSIINNELAYLTWGGILVTILIPLVFLIPGIAETFMRVVVRRLGFARDSNTAERFLESMRMQLRRSFWRSLVLTIAAFLVGFAQGWLICRAMGINIAYIDVMGLLAIAMLIGLVPITVSGVGVRELLFSLVMPSLGYDSEVGVGFGLMVFATIYLALAIAGFVSWQISPPISNAPVSSPDSARSS